MRRYKVFIACDSSNIQKIRKILRSISNNKIEIIPKFGLQFFYSKNGRKFLETYKKPFFLDVKIPQLKPTPTGAVKPVTNELVFLALLLNKYS